MKTGEFTFESTKETKYLCLVKTEVGEDERDACCRRNWALGSAREECFTCTRSTCPNQFNDPRDDRKPVLKNKWSPQPLRQNIGVWVMILYSLRTVFIFSPNCLLTRLIILTIRTGDGWRKLDPSQRSLWTEVNLLSIKRRDEQGGLKIADLLSS
jgi:hypothetical protein